MSAAAFVLAALSWNAGPQAGPAVLTPDRPGYRVKMARELVRLGTSRDYRRKVDLFLEAGAERVREMEALQAAGSAGYHAALGRCYDVHVTRGVAGVIEIGAAEGIDMAPCVSRCEEATSKHSEILARVLAGSPSHAEKALLHALEASRHGHDRALEAHQRGKGKEKKPKPPPPGKGRPGEPGRPEDDPSGKPKGGPPPGKGKPEEDEPGKGKDKGGPPPGKEGGPMKKNDPPGPSPGKGKGK